MPVKPILKLGNKVLKENNKEIKDFEDPRLKDLITDLVDTMASNELIGIAAPQVGENYQVFITEPRETEAREKDQSDERRIYINPKIVDQSDDEMIIYEGCGCIPAHSIFGPISRPKWVEVEAFDEKGEKFRFKADGILGRVILHEMDHLDGIEFIQKVTDNSKLMSIDHYREQIKSKEWHQRNSMITLKEYKKL